MRAIVTGGNGFLGHHLVKELIKDGIETVVYDVSDNHFSQNDYSNPLFQYIQGDILDPYHLNEAMQKCDLVFHTAAIADIDEARHFPVKTMDVNVIGTTNCLDVARKNEVKRFIFASSVYSGGVKGSFYRISKQAGESLCKMFYEDFGLQYTIIRYGSLYGREANQWNFIYTVCRELLLRGEFTYVSDPDSEREYVHITDASRETIRVANSESFINKTVLITGHQRIKIKELFFMIQEILGRDIKIHYTSHEQSCHYVMTPYSFEVDVPVRINLSSFVDISEGILDCLYTVQNDITNNLTRIKEE